MATTKRIKVHKHYYIYLDQVESLDELKKKTGGVDVTKIVRKALDHFFKLDKDKQLKIISEEE